MKKFIFKILTWFSLRCRLYYFWSRVYRWIWERGYSKIPGFATDYGIVEKIAGEMRWRRDTWLMLWDAISKPEATYQRFIDGKDAGDCDDIALFAIERLYDQASRNGRILRSTGRASFLSCDLGSFGLLSVPFLLKGKLAGHNVGVFRHRVSDRWEWCHVSNWYAGQIRFGFPSLEAVVEDVLSGEYGSFDPKAESLGWAYADLDLRLRRYRWKHKLIN